MSLNFVSLYFRFMINLDTKIEEFKEYYDTKFEYYNTALNFFIKTINSLSRVENTYGRIKNYNECLSKFKRKYLPEIDAENINYNIFDFLTDFVGIRAICFYSKDVPIIRKGLKKYFQETDVTNKTVILEKTDDKFGYKSLHLGLKLNNRYNKLPEFKNYKDIKFELQIRTVIQDAWSVLDHKIKYKKSIPQSLKRRINRLSALFEIADDEFLRINEEITLEEKKINERLKKGAAINKDKPIDVFRFLFIALKFFPEYKFTEYKVDGFVNEILDCRKKFTENDLNEAINKHIGLADKIAKNEKKDLNPYTKIRYCLYLFDQSSFSNILTVYQKNSIKDVKQILKI